MNDCSSVDCIVWVHRVKLYAGTLNHILILMVVIAPSNDRVFLFQLEVGVARGKASNLTGGAWPSEDTADRYLLSNTWGDKGGIQALEAHVLPTSAITVEPLYCGHHGNLVKCPVYRGVLTSWVNFY